MKPKAEIHEAFVWECTKCHHMNVVIPKVTVVDPESWQDPDVITTEREVRMDTQCCRCETDHILVPAIRK
jgi:hypothetical protein